MTEPLMQPKEETYSQLAIPTTIFLDRTLKILEPVVEYLKESKGLSYHEIAVLLNRNDRTIWTAYSRAKKKRQPHLHAALPKQGEPDAVFIPVSVIADRKLKVFEAIVSYLKETHNFTFHQIAVLLNRDDRTIWTINHRAQKKMGTLKAKKSRDLEGTP